MSIRIMYIMLNYIIADMSSRQSLTPKPFLHNDGALSLMKLVADFLITQRCVELLRCNRRRHPQNANASTGSISMNDIHQPSTDTTTLVRRINENTSNYFPVEACRTGNILA